MRTIPIDAHRIYATKIHVDPAVKTEQSHIPYLILKDMLDCSSISEEKMEFYSSEHVRFWIQVRICWARVYPYSIASAQPAHNFASYPEAITRSIPT